MPTTSHQREGAFGKRIFVQPFDPDAFEPVRFRLERLGRGERACAGRMQRRAFARPQEQRASCRPAQCAVGERMQQGIEYWIARGAHPRSVAARPDPQSAGPRAAAPESTASAGAALPIR